MNTEAEREQEYTLRYQLQKKIMSNPAILDKYRNEVLKLAHKVNGSKISLPQYRKLRDAILAKYAAMIK